MDKSDKKTLIKNTFNTVAEGYDNSALRFFYNSACNLPEIFGLQGHELVLDVATGTGMAALSLAPHVPRGQVTGIDFSEGMLEQARQKAQAQGLHNTQFLQMDMQAMELADEQFDAANCSFGLFFVEEMEELLEGIMAKLKPGAKVVACAFEDSAFQPLVEVFLQDIEAHGVERPPSISWQRLGSEEKGAAVFERVGLQQVKTHRYDVGYHLADANQWWDIIWYAGYRGLVNQLPAEQVEPFKQKHLQAIQTHATEQGIKLDIEVIYVEGRK